MEMELNLYELRLNENLPHLVKEKSFIYNTDGLTDPSKIYDMVNACLNLGSMAEEFVYVIAFNTKMIPIGIFQIAHGSANQTFLKPREIFIRMLICGATCLILVHNHPSGSTFPSTDDLNITERIVKAGRIIGLEVLDHIIIGKNSFYSFADEGKLQKI